MHKGLWINVRQYKFNSIFCRNFLLSVLMALLPLTIIGICIYQNNDRVVEYEARSYSAHSLNQAMAVMTTVISGADRIASDLLYDDDVKVFITSPEYNVIDENSYSNITMLLRSFSNAYMAIDSIYIYSEKNDFVISDQMGAALESFPDDTWKGLYANTPWSNSALVVSRRYGGNYPYYISIMHSGYLYDKAGAVVVNLDVEKLSAMVFGEDTKSSDCVYVVDAGNTVLFSQDKKLLGKNKDEIPALRNLKDNSSVIKHIGKEQYVVSTLTSSYHNLKFILLTPVGDFRERAGGLRRFFLYMLSGGLLLSICICFFLSVRLYRPWQKILATLEDTDSAASAQPLRKDGWVVADGEDKYIISNITKSINTRKEQEIELKNRMELLNRAQVAALLAQINPHFVHNTLETINIKAVRLGGYNNDVSKMVTDLSALLRLSLESDTHLATVADEAEHVKLYLRIMEQRFAGRFMVGWNIDPSIMNCKVVKICLQPVVENAILHGMKPLKRVCTISITGRHEENEIVLTVGDDGAGMSPDTMRSLRHGLGEIYSIKGHSVGLGNVNQRIKIIFGEEYGLTVESESGAGTTVRLRFPFAI